VRDGYVEGGLRRERNGSCPGQGTRELGEDRQVGVKLNTLKPTNTERRKRPLILEPSELALDGSPASV